MKELQITDPADKKAGYTSIRVFNFWVDGRTGEIQAVLVKCKDGEPDERECFDMPKKKLEPKQLDALLSAVFKHAQAADIAAEEETAELIADAEEQNKEIKARNAAAIAAAKKAKSDPPLPSSLVPVLPDYKRVIPDGSPTDSE